MEHYVLERIERRNFMISYEPMWATLQEKGITKYQLIYHYGLSSNTLRRMSHNEPISSTTLNELCLILNCDICDIMKFEPTESELSDIEQRKELITAKFQHKKKP